MLPILSENIVSEIISAILADTHVWRKKMVRYLKEENPEVNTILVELASKTDLDPKALATGAYAIYKALELADIDGCESTGTADD